MTETIDPDGDEEAASFDADGDEVADETGPAGTGGAAETATTYYDALGQVTGTVDAAGDATATAYDALGRVSETVSGYGGLSGWIKSEPIGQSASRTTVHPVNGYESR